jgi:hypothetical protein
MAHDEAEHSVLVHTSGKFEHILNIASRTDICSSVKPDVSIMRRYCDVEKDAWPVRVLHNLKDHCLHNGLSILPDEDMV